MASIQDWAAKAAQRIADEVDLGDGKIEQRRIERIAAIIATFAEPLMALVRESRREHFKSFLDEANDHDPCPKWEYGDERSCTCGADAWNARVDAVLDGTQWKCVCTIDDDLVQEWISKAREVARMRGVL